MYTTVGLLNTIENDWRANVTWNKDENDCIFIYELLAKLHFWRNDQHSHDRRWHDTTRQCKKLNAHYQDFDDYRYMD